MKTENQEIAELNSLGLSLTSIGKKMGLHKSTVKSRLASMGLVPADTRRAFMEEIYDTLSPSQRNWLVQELGAGMNIRAYVRKLILDRYIQHRNRK